MKTDKAFTLVELMIVVLIVSILAAVSIPQLTKAADKAIIAEAKAAMGVLKTQLSLFKIANDRYPNNALELAKSEYYNSSDMKCTYVDDSCFDYKKSGDGYKIICTSKYAGKASNVLGTYYKAPKVDEFKALGVELTLTDKGVFSEKKLR